MKEETVKNGRRITTSYSLENGYRVKVSTAHSATYKAIRTTVSECIYRQELNYAMETHRMYSDFMEGILSERVARYSDKALQDQHAKGVALAATIVSELLAQADKGERECQREVA